MTGLHLTADLRDCSTDCPAMTSIAALRDACLEAVLSAGLQPVGELFHGFPAPCGASAKGGVTGVVLLAESHLAVHTWPELRSVTLDVYVCNFSADNTQRAHQVMDMLQAAFSPRRIERHALPRGTLA